MSIVSIKELVGAGVHFGHRCSRWNPKMKPYIFGHRNLIHIIDLKETMKGLIRGSRFLANLAARGEEVLFVGTKRQARNGIITNAQRAGMPYVSERWLGGTLTNFRTITSRVRRLEELEDLEKTGKINYYSKKMIASMGREREKMLHNLEGIRNMKRLPGALVVIDPNNEKIAIAEARKLGIPTVALTDTDSDPDMVDIVIPGNDDAIRSIQLFAKRMADAVMEGKALAPKSAPKKEEVQAVSSEPSREGDRGRRGGPGGRRGERPKREAKSETQRLPGGKVVASERPNRDRRDQRGGRGGGRGRGRGGEESRGSETAQAAAAPVASAAPAAPAAPAAEAPKAPEAPKA